MGLNRLFDVIVRLPFYGHAHLIEVDLRYIAMVVPVMALAYVLPGIEHTAPAEEREAIGPP